MDMAAQSPWFTELGDMEDQLNLLYELPDMNYFDDIIPDDHDITALLGATNPATNMVMKSTHREGHQCGSSSTDSSAATLTTTAGRPAKQPRLQNSASAATAKTSQGLPVILNFGCASSVSDDDYQHRNVVPLENHREEEKQRFMVNNISARKADQTPAKRKSSTVKPAANNSRDHILAERRRREKITQHLIALSALLPGLKKMDKSSVLGEAINHIKQLQERVKTLEEDNARKMVESVVLVKKSQATFEDDDISSSGDNEDPPRNTKGEGHDQGHIQGQDHQLSGIEVKIWNNNMLLKLQCERREATLPKILGALENHGLSITTTHAVPFGDKSFDITIIAQMDREINPQSIVGDVSSIVRGF